MVKLRLKRMGRKKRPFYRIVAMDANAPQSGQALEEIGTYDPAAAVFDVDEEAALQWLKNGAQMSETVHNLMKSKGVLARHAGEEGVEKEGALSHDKPKRRKKLAGSKAAPAVEEAEAPAAAAEVEEAPVAAEVAAEVVVEAPAEAPTEAPVEEPAAEEATAEPAAEGAAAKDES